MGQEDATTDSVFLATSLSLLHPDVAGFLNSSEARPSVGKTTHARLQTALSVEIKSLPKHSRGR